MCSGAGHAPLQAAWKSFMELRPAARRITIPFVGCSWRQRLFSAARRLSVCSRLIWPSSVRFFATAARAKSSALPHTERSIEASGSPTGIYRTTRRRAHGRPLVGSSVAASSEETWSQVVSLSHTCSSQVGVILDVHVSLPIEFLQNVCNEGGTWSGHIAEKLRLFQHIEGLNNVPFLFA